MATDNPTFGVNVGSGRFRLPNRLRADRLRSDGIKLDGYETTDREALDLDAADAGLVVFDSDLGQAVLFDGTDWVNLDGSALA